MPRKKIAPRKDGLPKAGARQQPEVAVPKQGASPTATAAQGYSSFTAEPTEIVLGLVGRTGTGWNTILHFFEERLRAYGYSTVVIRVTKDVFRRFGFESDQSLDSFERVKLKMDFGNKVREESGRDAILAMAAAGEIAKHRASEAGIERVAYIICSLKRPEEVAELRKLYRGGFYLFGIYSSDDRRRKHLKDIERMSEVEADRLIERDENEQRPHGQHAQDTFHLADFFLADEGREDKLRGGIERSLDLIFGNHRITPTFNEYAMFMAFAAALRSGDLSRQVGAVVARNKEIISTGANDCPRFGGGLYWPVFQDDVIVDEAAGRDLERGHDSNRTQRELMIEKIASAFPDVDGAKKVLRSSPVADITEFGRAVHAEMEALIACARGGVSSLGATVFCTTFPCHNCAKHLVAAGIVEVVFVEPYPKSKALDLHDDAITMEKLDGEPTKVRFKPFIGVGPRQFLNLFSTGLGQGYPLVRKTPDGQLKPWEPEGALPRVKMLPVSYRELEAAASEHVKAFISDREGAGK